MFKLNKNILNDIFQDGMILPKNKFIKIGGVVNPEEKVNVKFLQKVYTAISNKNGDWQVTLPPFSGNDKYQIKVDANEKKQVVSNIQFGKVYLLSGQSNIEYRLKDEKHYKEVQNDLKQNKYPNLYFYNVPQIDYIDAKSEEIKPDNLQFEKWHHVNESNCGEMSAIGYYMIERLSQSYKDEPIAIVDCFKGGTSASVWIKQSDLADDNELKAKFLDEYHDSIKGKTWKDFNRETAEYNTKVEKHNSDLAKYLKMHPDVSLSTAKNIVGHTPWPPPARPDLFTRPSGLYKTMLMQVKHCSFNEMVWYQGENDTDRATQYKKLLPLLINTWRKELEDPSLPIKLIQLPGYADYPDNSGSIIRQIQLDTSKKIPGVGLVSFIDGGEEHNIHPTNKKVMGERLGKIITGNDYSGTPFVNKIKLENNKIILNVVKAQKLKLEGKASLVINLNNNKIQIININTSNLRENKIILSVENSNLISSISYCCSNYPKEIGIYNELDYPLSPFIWRF